MADNDQLLGEEFNADGSVKVDPDKDGQGSHQEPDYLELLVGDGKKYADGSNLAKGYANLQQHTNTILEEKLALQAKLDEMVATNRTVNDVLAAINGNPDDGVDRSDKFNQQHDGANQELSKEDITAMITGAFNQRDDDAVVQAEVVKVKANQKTTWEELSKVYGDKEKAKVAVALYVGNDENKKKLVQNLGSYDPTTLVSMLTTAIPANGEQVNFGNSDDGGHHPKQELPTPAGLFTYAQAEVVRKKNPQVYKSRDFQLRFHKSCAEHPNFWEGTVRK